MVPGERCGSGEVAIPAGDPRSASVCTAGPLTLLCPPRPPRPPRPRFGALLHGEGPAAYKRVHQIARVVVERPCGATGRLVGLLSEIGEELRGSLAPIVTEHQAAE